MKAGFILRKIITDQLKIAERDLVYDIKRISIKVKIELIRVQYL